MLKTIKGYENRYMVSDSGQIYSILRDKTLKGVPNSSGYLRVQLHDGKGHKSHLFIHRLVAEAFCDHPQGCDVVNHIDFLAFALAVKGNGEATQAISGDMRHEERIRNTDGQQRLCPNNHAEGRTLLHVRPVRAAMQA